MKDPWIWFWGILIFASIAWYAFLLFYVGYKGGRDVLSMTAALRERNRIADDEVGVPPK